MRDFRALIYIDGNDIWHVQGVEYDILAQGKTRKSALARFNATVLAEKKTSHELNMGIPEAPLTFAKIWDNGKTVTVEPALVDGITIDLRELLFVSKGSDDGS